MRIYTLTNVYWITLTSTVSKGIHEIRGHPFLCSEICGCAAQMGGAGRQERNNRTQIGSSRTPQSTVLGVTASVCFCGSCGYRDAFDFIPKFDQKLVLGDTNKRSMAPGTKQPDWNWEQSDTPEHIFGCNRTGCKNARWRLHPQMCFRVSECSQFESGCFVPGTLDLLLTPPSTKFWLNFGMKSNASQ